MRRTSGTLSINLNDRLVTRVEEALSRSVRTTVRVSCYPLALWFASSWWRLCWELAPSWRKSQTDWSLSHEMSSAGHGYLWPPMRFESDGEMVSVSCQSALSSGHEPIRYLTEFRDVAIPVPVLTAAIESFVQTVLARLEVVGIQDTELHALWQELSNERRDPRIALYRKLEAGLGFDPDDAPEDIVDFFMGLSAEAGKAAVGELAAACASRDSSFVWDALDKSRSSGGVPGSFSELRTLKIKNTRHDFPWDRGRQLARAARCAMGHGNDPISDKNLCDLLGLREAELTDSASPPVDALPWSLAIREPQRDEARLLFRRKHRCGRRFEMARWLGDFLADPQERWFPATDTKTARQKQQRAFAAEYLAPIDELGAFLGEAITDEERIEEAGRHFGVSALTVKSHLANHGLVHPDEVRTPSY
ncbi:MAG: hypothetical protein HQL98_06230 [Magnetococcales bacterium]|nr:hypothetical protein [Magnetococcales bacterium]